jgi:phage-related protein
MLSGKRILLQAFRRGMTERLSWPWHFTSMIILENYGHWPRASTMPRRLTLCIIKDTLPVMPGSLKPMPLQFWRSATGREPTRDWFQELPQADRKVLGRDLRRLQFGWPIGMPLVKSLRGGLWELRSALPSRREARIIFIVDDARIAVVHGFIKKTQKTPLNELDIAEKRSRELLT